MSVCDFMQLASLASPDSPSFFGVVCFGAALGVLVSQQQS
jgi:hypothetical protein